MWYAKPMRVDPKALARAKSTIAKTVRGQEDAQRRSMMEYKRSERDAMMGRNPDPLDALRREKIMHARPFPGIASLVGEAFGPREVTGSLKPYPREETGIIGNNTLPLSEELRAEVHQFYQESMTHARESGSLPYALSHAP